MTPTWNLAVGDISLGTLTRAAQDGEWTVCTFTPTDGFAAYREALSGDEIWEGEDDALDAVIDQISVGGLWLTSSEGHTIVDPVLTIEGSTARFRPR